MHAKRDSQSETNRFKVANQFITLASISLTSIFIMTFFLGSYINFNLAQSLSFYSTDGWCLGTKKLFGSHCFGDFGLPLFQVSAGPDVWTYSPPSNYTALNNLLFQLFHLLYLNIGYDQTLVLYLITIFLTYLYIIKDATKHFPLNMRILLITLVGISSPALLITLDRGNSTGFIGLPLYQFIKSGVRNENRNAILWGTLLVLMRPQFLLILLLFISLKKWKSSILFLLLTIITYLATFAIWDFNKTIINLKLFVFSLVRYSDIPIGITWPYNYSFANFIALLFNKGELNFSPQAINVVILVTILSCYLMISRLIRMGMDPSIVFLIGACAVLPLCFLIPSTSYSYYSIIPYVIFFAIISTDKIDLIKDRQSLKIYKYYLFVVSITILPWLIPFPTDLGIGYLNLAQSSIGFFWLSFYLMILLSEIVRTFRK